MKRGEIWTVAGGAGYAGKPRPGLIVQDDLFDETGSVTICLITSHDEDAGLFRPAVSPSATNGLREPSRVMVDKITTVPRDRLRRRIGTLSAAPMREVNRAIALFLGLAG